VRGVDTLPRCHRVSLSYAQFTMVRGGHVEMRRFLHRADTRADAVTLQRRYAGVLTAAGFTPEYTVDICRPPGSPHWRVELCTDTTVTPGSEGADRWEKAFLVLSVMALKAKERARM
jgi:hypothetical protein